MLRVASLLITSCFLTKFHTHVFVKISSAPIPHDAKSACFLVERHSFSRGKRTAFCTNTDETLCLVCTKLELLSLKPVSLEDECDLLKD